MKAWFSPVALLLCATADAWSASPIVISGWLTNVSGNDSPYEYAQFVATQDIDLSTMPFTIVWNDVGVEGTSGAASFSDGWSGGSLLTYAFQLTSGTVTRGETFYVGGSAQVLADDGSASLAGERWLRSINTATTGGDGLGVADPDGVFGNGGPHSDGIAVFAGLAGSITSTSVPLDTVFFGNAVGNAKPATGGFKAAQNDRYTSSGVFGDPGNAFLFPDLAQNQFARLSGTYNYMTGEWEAARTAGVVQLSTTSQPSAIASAIVLVPEPASSATLLVGGLCVAMRRRGSRGVRP
ncbi:MAG: hypothetical protein ACO1QR_10640 [Chthoniobacteraceae bacterium]